MTNTLIQFGAAELLPQSHPIQLRTLVDRSSSVGRLQDVIAKAMTKVEQGLATVPGSEISRTLFDRDFYVLDSPDGDGGVVNFIPAGDTTRRPFTSLYNLGRGTYLERWLSRELQALRNRFDADELSRSLHVLALMTDGEDSAPENYKRAHVIRTWMDQIIERAQRCGGIRKSRIAVYYMGVGLTRERHLAIANGLYNIPEEWIAHFPATPEAIRRLGDDATHTVIRMGRGGETVIGN